MPEYTIRPFRTPAEFRACVRLQEEVWGAGFSERVPVAILMSAQRIGGVSAGAFGKEDGCLLGFVFGMTGIEGGELAHWSDMLAVRPGLREAGLGLALKRYQRDILLGRGVRTVRWTFDPLMAKNAYLNIEKLGAVAREYRPDLYGDTGSPLHGGIGTDRLVALWALDSPRVEARLGAPRTFDAGSGRPGEERDGATRPDAVGEGGAQSRPGEPRAVADPVPDAAPTGIVVRDEDGSVRPERADLDIEDDVLLVPVPADIQALKAQDAGLAKAWRAATRSALMHYLEQGHTIDGFRRGQALSHYVLSRSTRTEPSKEE